MVKGRMVQFETDCTACYKRVKNVVCLELGSATIRLCRECRPLVIDELKLFQEHNPRQDEFNGCNATPQH